MEEQKNDFKGFSLFNDVKDPKLQAYNRAAMLKNLRESHGDELANNYYLSFGGPSQFGIITTMMFVKEHGWDEVKRRIINGFEESTT